MVKVKVKAKDIEVGQIVYINTYSPFLKSEPSEPVKFEVSKINTSSIYAVSCDKGTEFRFDKRSLVCNHGNGYRSEIWLSVESYWDYINRCIKKAELLIELRSDIGNLDFDSLLKVSDFISNLK